MLTNGVLVLLRCACLWTHFLLGTLVARAGSSVDCPPHFSSSSRLPVASSSLLLPHRALPVPFPISSRLFFLRPFRQTTCLQPIRLLSHQKHIGAQTGRPRACRFPYLPCYSALCSPFPGLPSLSRRLNHLRIVPSALFHCQHQVYLSLGPDTNESRVPGVCRLVPF